MSIKQVVPCLSDLTDTVTCNSAVLFFLFFSDHMLICLAQQVGFQGPAELV